MIVDIRQAFGREYPIRVHLTWEEAMRISTNVEQTQDENELKEKLMKATKALLSEDTPWKRID